MDVENAPAEQQYCLRWNNHHVNLLSVFDALLENTVFSDVSLVPEDGPPFIKCHKMLLASCSTFFEALFAHYPTNDSHPLIVLKGVKYRELKAILEYMYRGEVNVAQDQLPELLKVAELLKVKGLVEETKHEKSHDKMDKNLSSPPGMNTSIINNHHHPEMNGYTSPPPNCGNSAFYSSYNTSPRAPHYQPIASPRTNASHTALWNNLSASVMAQHQNQLAYQHQAQLHSPVLSRGTPMFTGFETNDNKMRKQMGFNKDTPILRTVLGQGQGQGHNDHSQSAQHADNHELYRSPSNDSAHDDDGRRSSTDRPNGCNGTSPPTSEDSINEDEQKKTDTKKKQEWKRYKQYSRKNIQDAIAAVRGGMSALKAATQYNVPSRTLYDKVKKLGITTPRPFRRANAAVNGNMFGNTRGGSARFPTGVGGNVNGRIYAAMSRTNEHELPNAMSIDVLPPTPRPDSPIHDNSIEHHQESNGAINTDTSATDPSIKEDHDEVEDLSLNRKNDVRVIVPIKEEKIESPDNVGRQ